MTLKRRFALCLLFLAASARAVFYDTYAAWGDVSNANHGHLYIYTGGAASTDFYLYQTGTAGTTINQLVTSATGIGPYRPAFSYPNEDGPVGFGNRYFKLQSTEPMTWEVDENTNCHCGDAHGMVAAADNQNTYIGSIFMTYMRRDTDTEAPTSPPGLSQSMFGDQLAVISTASGPITAQVSRWNAGTSTWNVVVAASPSIPAGGVWMWSPDQSAPPLSGGTLAANAGHYRVDLTGGQGMLYKGNVFSPMPFNGRGYAWNRDNALMVSPDMATGRKIGTNLFGVVVANHSSNPQIIVSNMGTGPANFDLMRFVPNSPGTVDLQWPISGNDPSGTWTTVATGTGIAAGDRYTYTSTFDGFFRVVATNGQPLTAIMGTALTRQKYTGGDYVYAKDTNQAMGKQFEWWGHLTNQGAGEPLEVHVVAPWANTQVTVNATGNPAQVQTTSGPDQGLKFNITSTADQNVKFTVSSTQFVYVWFMSNTVGGTFGETFFSNPPMPQDLMVAEKSASPSTVSLGETVTYVLTANNIGAGVAVGVEIWDTLPSGVTFVSANPAPTINTPPYFQWDLGSLGGRSAVAVTMVATVDVGVNGEVKNNYAMADSAAAPQASSPNAPVRILIPGADLQKSVNVATANPGDTVTYVISYLNSAAPLPPTPRLDLRVTGMNMDGTNIAFNFNVRNFSGAPVDTADLTICYWIQDPAAPGSLTFTNWYGGECASCPTYWQIPGGGGHFSGPAFSLAPPVLRPDTRNANIAVCWDVNTSRSLPDGQTWSNIQLALTHPTNSWNSTNYTSINYSRRAAGEGGPNQDSHFALFHQGNLVAEYSGPGTPDPATGCEPRNWVSVWDSIPADLNYVGSSPAATLAGSVLSWFDPCVQPQQSRAFTWWGTVKAGTAQGTVIENRAYAQADTITALSLIVTVQVPIVGTLTHPPTITPSLTFTPTRTPTPTVTPSITMTVPGSPTRTPTASPSFTLTPTPSATPTVTLTPTRTITVSFTHTPTLTQTLTPVPTATNTPEPLLLSPLPSSPNPGGPNGLYIAYRLSVDAEVNIMLYTVAGEKVRDLDTFRGRMGANEQFWDAKNAAGQTVGSGIFITRIIARSAQGEQKDLWGKVSILR